ncbi:MAG: response regulator [Sedimentisphaerales bacterium]|nr:response regulator [Sedimentisphaerales bacterium]
MVRKHLNILLVEDNPGHASLLMRQFENHDLEGCVRLVTDGNAALDYLCRRGKFADPTSSPHPDVILLDLRLPGLDGIEVLRQVKCFNNLDRIPVIVLTSSVAHDDAELASQYYVDGFLVKPVDFEMLRQVLDDIGIKLPVASSSWH